MKTLLLAGAIVPIAYVFLMYSPTLLDFNPTAYSIPFPSFEGPLEENCKLSEAEILFQGELRGPESIVFYKGDLYTGLEDGRIVKVKDGKVITVAQTGRYCEMPYEERQCGRPLGMRIGKDNLLYVIDAYYGIFTMNFTTGALTRILPSSVLVDGEKLNFPDDLDMDDEGNIYFTDASKKWDLATIYYMMIEYENGGRVVKYNVHTGETKVLMSGLHFPNGLQLAKDKKSLLVNELMNRRILRYYIKGPKKGKVEVFADNLPAEPDNIRPSPRGYWVAFTSARNSSNTLIVDSLNSYPQVKRLWVRLHHSIGTLLWSFAELTGHPVVKTFAYRFKRGDVILPFIPRHGIVIEFDENGKMLRSLHSPDGKINALSEVKEHEGYLYLGSFTNHYLGRLKL
ncbi:adipocyte plasma membrane-associated protein [Parasteatoda tepidariorum]|uniref:adipocyte plasma membrane-associated protein n=1 Tax=Parasteatoda tepidariorum TaxID=114398 RepID=UPI00077FD982|nr:adipocyte plasma membrane-associated protein [Parasteatoda tepidariorum]XP_042897996.1 adipocyte plasma membrane-associated protein [Parasteatoda tepidariorum]XP_042897997.1 adipocyte plasma membrane-associated protein [Parasteatoda tepidariorum]